MFLVSTWTNAARQMRIVPSAIVDELGESMLRGRQERPYTDIRAQGSGTTFASSW